MKNPMTPAGIEPATFQFVAQQLNHCNNNNNNNNNNFYYYLLQFVCHPVAVIIEL